MMSMRYPYGNTNTAGQNLYGTAVCPPFGVNYNQYFASFYSNSNGLLPKPLMMEDNRQKYKPLMSENPYNNSFSMPYGQTYNINSNDFLTFIEHKTKSTSELNPFANEFSLTKNNQLVLTNNNNEKRSSYKIVFDDLIEQSLQSIEAIKKASKIVSVNHVSTQCHQSIDQINRSTQTNDDNDQYNLLEEYSSRAVKLMENLLVLLTPKNDSLSHICNELDCLILTINQLITSINRDNLFSNIVKDDSIQSSPIIFGIDERTRRMISSSMSYSSTPSFSSRQIDTIAVKRSKLCLLCRKPVDDNDDDLHELCRLLSSPPGASMNI